MKDRYWILAMPLEMSWLCVNCDSVVNVETRCPVCLSEVLLSLSKILNRDKPEPDA
jgi:hypothetical protein